MTAIASTTHVAPISQKLEPIGQIVRLQVQVSSLKVGEKPRRWYNPEFIQAVPELRLDEGGVTGIDGSELADVHHRDHPQSKFRGENGISVGFTGHYTHMRARFGDHLRNGIAGENILVDADRELAEVEVSGGIVIVGVGGPVRLRAVQSAPPCVEFSKFCAGYPVEQKADTTITETLRFLNDGMRGFYATLEAGTSMPVMISVGDTVYRVRR